MKTKTTIILAAGIFLALGIGGAMAQSEVPADAGYGGQQPAVKNVRSQVQSGSSDTDTVRSGAHAIPFEGDYGDLANPG